MGRKLQPHPTPADRKGDHNTAEDYRKLAALGNPAQQALLNEATVDPEVLAPKRAQVPGGRGDLTEMTAREFLKKGFPNMSRKERRLMEAKMKRRDRKGKDPLTGA